MAASASTSTSNHLSPTIRKRVGVGPPSLIRNSNGSAFTLCDSCNKHVPAATADMHDCKQDAKAKAFLAKPLETAVKEVVSSTAKIQAPQKKMQKRKARNEAPEKQLKKKKKAKDPNEPKRPQTAFFLFMEEFRKTFKEANPNVKGIAAVAKEGGDKWKSMSDEEKAPFVRKAAELKEEYAQALKACNSSDKDDNCEDAQPKE